MTKVIITDKEKLDRLVKEAKISRSELARALEVSYKTVYRWLDKGIKPHPAQSHHIDELFKEYIDLSGLVNNLRKTIKDPVKLLQENPKIRDKFFLEMTYNSNAIEGSRMTIKETEKAIKGERVKGKELYEVLEVLAITGTAPFLIKVVL